MVFGGLAETGAEPSLQATQMKLKRARLADDLNEKIAQRPGPMELVEKNILPVDSSLKEAIIGNYVNKTGTHQKSSQWSEKTFWTAVMCFLSDLDLLFYWVDGQMHYPKTLEDFPIDEDSGDALSPEQPASQESQSSAASPGDVRTMEEPPPLLNHFLQVDIVCWTSVTEYNENFW